MYFTRSSLLVFLFVCWISPAIANDCSKEDRDYANSWGNYYAPQDARDFGRKIQGLVFDKNLSGIFSLVRGELYDGPRKSFVASKSFDEVFDESWVELVLSNDAPCSPVGWRGFMLGNGSIWYYTSKIGWEIGKIHGAAQETFENPSPGWTINKRIVHPFCFNRPSIEELSATAIKKEFYSDPGLFMGSTIASFAPMRPSWCSKDGECWRTSWVAQLEQCSAENFDLEEGVGTVWTKKSSGGYDDVYHYTILGALSDNRCSELAPHIGVDCKKSYLVSVGDYSDGTMGWYSSVGIYGFFDLPNFGPSIIPLKFFPNKNEGLNFLDKD